MPIHMISRSSSPDTILKNSPLVVEDKFSQSFPRVNSPAPTLRRLERAKSRLVFRQNRSIQGPRRLSLPSSRPWNLVTPVWPTHVHERFISGKFPSTSTSIIAASSASTTASHAKSTARRARLGDAHRARRRRHVRRCRFHPPTVAARKSIYTALAGGVARLHKAFLWMQSADVVGAFAPSISRSASSQELFC